MTNEPGNTNVPMGIDQSTLENNAALLSDGLRLLEEALAHFMKMDNCIHGSAIASIAHGLILLGEAVYESYKNRG